MAARGSSHLLRFSRNEDLRKYLGGADRCLSDAPGNPTLGQRKSPWAERQELQKNREEKQLLRAPGPRPRTPAPRPRPFAPPRPPSPASGCLGRRPAPESSHGASSSPRLPERGPLPATPADSRGEWPPGHRAREGARTDAGERGHLWEQRSVGGEPGGGSWRLGLAAKVQSLGVGEGGQRTATWALRSRRGRGGGCLW